MDAIPAPGGVCSLGAHTDHPGDRPPVRGGVRHRWRSRPSRTCSSPSTRTATRHHPDVPRRRGAGRAGARRQHGQSHGVSGCRSSSPSRPGSPSTASRRRRARPTDAVDRRVDRRRPLAGSQADPPARPPVVAHTHRATTWSPPRSAATSRGRPRPRRSTVHEPADRYAVAGGPSSGDCLTPATGCAYRVRHRGRRPGDRDHLRGAGEHVIAESLGITNKSVVALDPADRPTIRARPSPAGWPTTGGTVSSPTSTSSPPTPGCSTGKAAAAPRSSGSPCRQPRRALFTGDGSLTVLDSVLEAVGGSPERAAVPPRPRPRRAGDDRERDGHRARYRCSPRPHQRPDPHARQRHRPRSRRRPRHRRRRPG